MGEANNNNELNVLVQTAVQALAPSIISRLLVSGIQKINGLQLAIDTANGISHAFSKLFGDGIPADVAGYYHLVSLVQTYQKTTAETLTMLGFQTMIEGKFVNIEEVDAFIPFTIPEVPKAAFVEVKMIGIMEIANRVLDYYKKQQKDNPEFSYTAIINDIEAWIKQGEMLTSTIEYLYPESSLRGEDIYGYADRRCQQELDMLGFYEWGWRQVRGLWTEKCTGFIDKSRQAVIHGMAKTMRTFRESAMKKSNQTPPQIAMEITITSKASDYELSYIADLETYIEEKGNDLFSLNQVENPDNGIPFDPTTGLPLDVTEADWIQWGQEYSKDIAEQSKFLASKTEGFTDPLEAEKAVRDLWNKTRKTLEKLTRNLVESMRPYTAKKEQMLYEQEKVFGKGFIRLTQGFQNDEYFGPLTTNMQLKDSFYKVIHIIINQYWAYFYGTNPETFVHITKSALQQIFTVIGKMTFTPKLYLLLSYGGLILIKQVPKWISVCLQYRQTRILNTTLQLNANLHSATQENQRLLADNTEEKHRLLEERTQLQYELTKANQGLLMASQTIYNQNRQIAELRTSTPVLLLQNQQRVHGLLEAARPELQQGVVSIYEEKNRKEEQELAKMKAEMEPFPEDTTVAYKVNGETISTETMSLEPVVAPETMQEIEKMFAQLGIK